MLAHILKVKEPLWFAVRSTCTSMTCPALQGKEKKGIKKNHLKCCYNITKKSPKIYTFMKFLNIFIVMFDTLLADYFSHENWSYLFQAYFLPILSDNNSIGISASGSFMITRWGSIRITTNTTFTTILHPLELTVCKKEIMKLRIFTVGKFKL